MALFTNQVCLALLALASYLYICLCTTSSVPQNNYPCGSLACKTYEKTKIDRSRRSLLLVPVLDQNSTIFVNLSNNQLKNITGTPFDKLHILLELDLSYNQISWISSMAFRGLQSLVSLNLQVNHLYQLPDNIFADLSKLLYLNMDNNRFPAIPSHAMCQLRALQLLHFNTLYCCFSEIQLGGFENLTKLNT